MTEKVFRREMVPLAEIRTDGPQCRADGIDEAHLKTLKSAAQDGATMDPVRLVKVGEGDYVTVDGWHRLELDRRDERTDAEALVCDGTEEEAAWLAAGANKEHLGLPRKPRDRKKAVEMALMVRPDLVDSVHAEHVGVSRSTVCRARAALEQAGKIRSAPVRTGANGRQIDTSGQNARTPGEDAEDPEEVAGAFAASQREDTQRRSEAAASGRIKAQPPGPVLDSQDVVVPEKLRGAFCDQTLRQLAERFDALAQGINPDADARLLGQLFPVYRFVIVKADGRPHLNDRMESVKWELEEIRDSLRHGIPDAVCPRCRGEAGPCDGCRGTGLVPAWRLDELEGRGP